MHVTVIKFTMAMCPSIRCIYSYVATCRSASWMIHMAPVGIRLPNREIRRDHGGRRGMNYAGIPTHAGVSSAGHKCGSDSLSSPSFFFSFSSRRMDPRPLIYLRRQFYLHRLPLARELPYVRLLIYSAHLGRLSRDKESYRPISTARAI